MDLKGDANTISELNNLFDYSIFNAEVPKHHLSTHSCQDTGLVLDHENIVLFCWNFVQAVYLVMPVDIITLANVYTFHFLEVNV